MAEKAELLESGGREIHDGIHVGAARLWMLGDPS